MAQQRYGFQTKVFLKTSVKVMTREELISLSGEVANGMLSADDSIISKIIDRTIHKQIADSAVDVAYEMLRKIDNEYRF